MELKPIKTELDYRAALKRLEEIFDAKLGSSESDELEILGLMVDDLKTNIIRLRLLTRLKRLRFAWKKCT